MLWLCLNFPRLPIEIFLRAGVSRDPLVVSSGGNRPLIIACDERAQHAGIRNGMALSAAYALLPEIAVRTRDPGVEQRCLEEIALWAIQFTPQISLLPPASLLLEIGGSLKLFGGLDALRRQIGESA